MADYTLTWSPASSGGTITVDGYDVEYTPEGGASVVVETGSASTSYTLTGLSDSESFGFRVRGKDGSLAGPWSDSVGATFRILTAAGDSLQTEGGDFLAWND
jgi:hypothetical protein